jgi:hypothetical protein
MLVLYFKKVPTQSSGRQRVAMPIRRKKYEEASLLYAA